MISLYTQCDSCGGTGVSGFKLLTNEAVKCKLCFGSGWVPKEEVT